MTMHICFLAPANSIHSFRWVKYFVDRGYRITWISLHEKEGESLEGVRYEFLRKTMNPLSVWRLAAKARRMIRDAKPDVLHVHSAVMYGLVGALSGFHPMILTPWGSDILSHQNSLVRKPMIRFMLDRADLITTDADHMMRVMETLGGDKKKMHLVYFGIDTQRFRPLPKDPGLKENLGTVDAPAIFSLRNFIPLYDVESLVRAVPHVLREVPRAKFIIAGSGPQKEMFESLARSLGVSESIRFVGKLENARLPQYLSCMDLYVSTSLSDAGLAASTAEAMACGVPVVITDSGENRKWVQDGENGFVVSVKSPEALAQKIVTLLKDEALRRRFAKLGREAIEKKNNYDIEMDKMGKFYSEMVSARP